MIGARLMLNVITLVPRVTENNMLNVVITLEPRVTDNIMLNVVIPLGPRVTDIIKQKITLTKETHWLPKFTKA
jgi:hypothetical protein